MQITVTFDSLEEFQKYMTTGREVVEIEPREAAAHVSGMCPITAQAPAGQPEAPKAEEKPKKAEKPAEKPQDEEPAPAPEDKPKMDMITARKILADLNKATGTNVARATLKKLGYASLKAVPEDKLQEVVDTASEEVSND